MVTNSPANAGDLRGAGWSSGLRRSPGEGNGNPLWYFPGESRGQRNLVGHSPWRCKESDTTEATWHTAHMHIYMGFLGGGSGKEPACQCRRHKRCRLEPWVGRSPGEENGNLLQYSCLGNPMDRGAQQATVHRITRVEKDLVTKQQQLTLNTAPPSVWSITC